MAYCRQGHNGHDVTKQIPATLETVSQPRLRRLLDYWQARRGDRPMPGRADIDPLDFPWLLGNVSLVDVVPDGRGGRRYRLRLVGTHVTRRFGYDGTGKWLDEILGPEHRAHVQAAFDDVVRQRIPMVERLDMLIDGRLHDYEILRLPLASDGQTVDILLLAADFFDPTV